MNALGTVFPVSQSVPPNGTAQGDPLSDVFGTVRMTGAVFFRVAARAPWVAEQLSREAVLPMILPGAGHMISFHIVTEGTCYANLIGDESVKLKAGQVIVFTRGDPHVMSSCPNLRLSRFAGADVCGSAPAQLPFTASFGDEGPVTAKVICGFLACDSRPFNPLLDNLPPVLIGDSNEGAKLPALRELVALALDEASGTRAGGQTILARMTELMFIEVVRQHLERLPADSSTWIAGLRDTCGGRALALLHGDPGKAWSLEGLSREVGLSRSELAQRFASFVGLPPMQYLAKWRMQRATALLRESVNIAAVADEVGYSSEASFSRAFKKIVGVPPSQWRQSQTLLAA